MNGCIPPSRPYDWEYGAALDGRESAVSLLRTMVTEIGISNDKRLFVYHEQL